MRLTASKDATQRRIGDFFFLGPLAKRKSRNCLNVHNQGFRNSTQFNSALAALS